MGVAGILLLWIFHSIFLSEGQAAWTAQGNRWAELSRGEQWRIAWAYGPRGLWTTLSLVRPLEFVGSLAFMGATVVLGLLRWRLVLQVQGLNIPLAQVARISFIAHFFNGFLLGSTGGDVLKAYYASRETAHHKTEAVTSVLVDRLLGLFAMLLFAGIMMWPNARLLADHRRLSALASLVLVMLLACSTVLMLSFWGGLSSRWPQARAWLKHLPKGELLERALEACRRCGRHQPFFLHALALSMLLNLCCVLQVFLLVRGLGLHIDPFVLLMAVPTIICISALPVTPSGLGVRENLFVMTLTVPEIGIASTHALSLSLLAYAGSLFWSLVGGIIYLCSKDRFPNLEAEPKSPR